MVVADTDIIIAAIRGNEMAKQLLIKYHPNIYISVVTEMELTIGATNPSRKNAVKEVLRNHDVVYINKAICETALQLVATYNTVSRSLYLADALIAATCINKGFSLLTFNTKDFRFIKGLRLTK